MLDNIGSSLTATARLKFRLKKHAAPADIEQAPWSIGVSLIKVWITGKSDIDEPGVDVDDDQLGDIVLASHEKINSLPISWGQLGQADAD